jgi:hypothetical protein
MIWAENVLALDTTLHRSSVDTEVNKVNARKEPFRSGPAALRKGIEEIGLNVAETIGMSHRSVPATRKTR